MKKLLTLAAALFATAVLAAAPSQGPLGIFGGTIPTASLAPAALVPANTYAFTSDSGLLVDNGSSWVSVSTAASSAFGSLSTGTNTTAAMVVGTGASLTYSGSGSIAALTATALAATPAQCPNGQFATGVNAGGGANCGTPVGSGNVSTSGTITSGNLPVWNASTTLTGTTAVGSNTLVGNNGSGIAALTPAQSIGVLNSTACTDHSADYTLALTDANVCQTMTSASAHVFTIPTNASVAFPVGTLVNLQALSTGAVTLTVTSLTINSGGPYDVTGGLGGIQGQVQLIKVATDTWSVVQFYPGNTGAALTGTCSAAGSSSLGLTGGTITLPSSGTVNACTIIMTPKVKAKTMWLGLMCDETQPTVPCWGPTSQSPTAVIFTLPAAPVASDVLMASLQAQ